ncbi:hypothetical protein RQP46_007906 [Phenoliferia psychrophenolica]
MLVPPSPQSPQLSEIELESSADQLKEWEETARDTWSSADKAIRVRLYHRRHFHNATDFGRDVVQPLKRIRDELELRMRALNTRSHALILASEDASWLLPETLPASSPSHPPPFHPPSPSSDLRPPTSPPLQPFTEEPDPVLAQDRVRRAELLELISLTGSHASFIRDSRKSVERVRVVECLMRRVISRDEVLLVRAYRGGHDHVLRFFEDPLCCTLIELSRLWALLQQTTVVQIKEAVMDAFRAMRWEESGAGETEEGEEGLGLQLIGGWTYKVQLAKEMEWTAWDHVYDLVGCPNCALRICSSFAEWARIRRLTVVPHGPSSPPYELWGDPDESDASRIFRALDVVKCGEQRADEVAEGLSHPRAASILSHLSRHYTTLIRASHAPSTPLTSFPIPPHANLWFARHRSSPSRPSLRHEPWATDPHATEQTTVASEWTDATFDVLVLDSYGRSGTGTGRTSGNYISRSFEKFEAELGEGVSNAVGVDGVKAKPTARVARPPSALKQGYLILYNLGSASAWALVLSQLVSSILNSNKSSIIDAAAGTFSEMGRTTQIVQTFAGLEVIHAALGLVRSSFSTTLSQVFSRYLMVWYTLQLFPQVGHSPIYATMVLAWSVTEIVRYSFYATGLMGVKVGLLEVARYNTFYALYPLGAGSEAWLILKSAPYAEAMFGPAGLYATYALCTLWPPALAFLMSHMHAQRRKHLKAAKAAKAGKKQ